MIWKQRIIRLGIILIVFSLLASIREPHTAQATPGKPPCPPGMQPRDDNGACESRLSTPDVMIADPVAPQATGGPDTFGYTWDDSASYSWKNADTWTTLVFDPDNPLAGVDDGTAVADLPFAFPFYEGSYNQVYVTTNGVIGFDGSVSAKTHSLENLFMPFDYAYPQNVIAAFWDDLAVGGGFVTGFNDGSVRVGPVSDVGGDYFIIEYNKVTRKFGDTDSELTFQIVLYASGNILIQYQIIETGVILDSCTVGIEDLDGEDGLMYLFNTAGLAPGDAILFSRPVDTNRVKVFPQQIDSWVVNSQASYEFYVRNTGELGVDLFNLTVALSDPSWSLALYDATGQSTLGDADSNGDLDTGWLSQGETYTVTAVVQAPTGAPVGDQAQFTVTATTHSSPQKSRDTVLKAAIPTRLALLYRDGTRVYTDFVSEDQVYVGQGHDGYTGSDFALSNPSNGGRYVSVREKTRPDYLNDNYTDLEFTILGSTGQVLLGPKVLWWEIDPYLWPQDIHPWRDVRPAVAIAPNGNIGIAWVRVTTRILTEPYKVRYNIYFALLDPQGHLLYDDYYFPDGVRNVTNNTIFYETGGDKLSYEAVHLTATLDNTFYLSWIEKQSVSGRLTGDLSHAVYYADTGAEVQGPELLTDGEILDRYDWWEAVVENYQPSPGVNRVLMGYVYEDTTNELSPIKALKYRIMDTAGTEIQGETTLYAGDGEGLDICQASNGKVAIAWTDPDVGKIKYALMDQDLSWTGPPSILNNPDNRRGGAVSVTHDSANRFIITWMDIKWFGRLYYALVSPGVVITPPMTVKYTQSNLETALQTRVALGNAPYEPWFRLNLPLVVR